MISICIPVFNTPIHSLVQELSRQAANAPVPFEILVLDDASSPDIEEDNRSAAAIPFVRYYTNPKNRGRILARSRLAQLAAYDWLLFLDDDSVILRDDFLIHYYGHATDTNCVVTGGRKYTDIPPDDCRYLLHWKYGTKRENSWHEKNTTNLKGFQTNNFLLHKKVFGSLIFPAEMVKYGHEDTWMGMQLEQQGRAILHISNPVLHNRLETADQFLEKSRRAIENLRLLSKITDDALLIRHVKIYRTYKKWQQRKMLPVVSAFFSLLNKRVQKNLHSCSPDLFLFDLYRLNYLIGIFR